MRGGKIRIGKEKGKKKAELKGKVAGGPVVRRAFHGKGTKRRKVGCGRGRKNTRRA